MLETVHLISQILLWPLCLSLVGLILLQGGAGDLSSAFGGGGMLDSTLGVGASKKMAKVTGWLGFLLFVLVLLLAIKDHGGGFGKVPGTSSAPAAAPATATVPAASGAPVVTPAAAPTAAAPAATVPVAAPAAPASASPTPAH